jgi:hypothetical protein
MSCDLGAVIYGQWLMRERKDAGVKSISAVVAVRNSPFAGLVHVVFKSVMHVWKKICGVSPAVGLTGSALIAAP